MAQSKKIVILDGGMSGLAAAFGITCAPNWQQRYDVTVVQPSPEVPSTGSPERFECLLRVLEWITHKALDPRLAYSPTAVADSQSAAHFANSNKPSWLASLIGKAETAFDPDACHPELKTVLAESGHPAAIQFLLQAYKVLRASPARLQGSERNEAGGWLLDAFRSSFRRLAAGIDPADDRLRRILILIDLGVAEVVGNLSQGSDEKEKRDLRAWFTLNGAFPDSVNSLMFWRTFMGAGEAVFAPLCETLQSRGVQLRFSEKALALGLDDSKKSIETISVSSETKGRYALQAGQDFDVLILTTQSASFPDVCAELVHCSSRWASMAANAFPSNIPYRMGPDESGFDNLYVAEDWPLRGLYFGYMESAKMGGLETSRAICGYPREVVGESEP